MDSRLYNKLKGYVITICRALGASYQDAEEVYNDTMLQISLRYPNTSDEEVRKLAKTISKRIVRKRRKFDRRLKRDKRRNVSYEEYMEKADDI